MDPRYRDFLGQLAIASEGKLAAAFKPELVLLGEPGCEFLIVGGSGMTEEEWIRAHEPVSSVVTKSMPAADGGVDEVLRTTYANGEVTETKVHSLPEWREERLLAQAVVVGEELRRVEFLG